MNASTLNPKAEPVIDKRTDTVESALQAVYRLRRAIRFNTSAEEIVDRCEVVKKAIDGIERFGIVEAEFIGSNVILISEHVTGGFYSFMRPLLMEVVAAIERQIELVAERGAE